LLATPYRVALGLTPFVRKDLEAFQPDIIHLASPDLLGFAAQDWARRRKIPIVTTFHTHFNSYLPYYRISFLDGICWRLQRYFYHQADEVYVACESMAEVLRRNGITKNLTIVPFGVDQDNFTPQRRSQEWRSAHGVGPQEVLVGFVGRLVWEKSLGLWAEVIRRLEAAGIPHRSVMVGEGPAGPELQKMLPNTRFTGRLTGPDLATAFASMDLFFHPSDSETFGCVTVEALASGLACLVADATGSRDIVRHDQEGLVCPPHQPEAFYQALLQLIQNPGLRQRYQAQALQRANAYRWENVLAEMLGNFRRVASQRPIRRLRKTSST
jgi:glycosyltransferase involved in cell wall biosynthesis